MNKELEDIIKGHCTGTHDTLLAALRDFRGDSYAPYYSDINELYDRFETELWDMLAEYHEEIGENRSLLELLDNMNMRYSNEQHITNLQGVKQWLVWFGLEHVAHRLADELEEQE